MSRQLVSILFICLIFIGCQPDTTTNRAIYYWKTNYQLSSQETETLKQSGINTMYLRLFDVGWDEQKQVNIPLGRISFKTAVTARNTIPVVYITQEAINNEQIIDSLAAKICRLVTQTVSHNKFSFKELQLDCDWTDDSKDKYFQLLKTVKKLLPNKIISCTIRLHQIKYRLRSGIPPVDRGMLMFYNMGDLKNPGELNSIYDEETAKLYSDYIHSYPLKLDLALPAFSWLIQFRNNKIQDVLSEISETDLNDTTSFDKLDELHWRAKKSLFLHGAYFITNDLIKQERTNPQLCQKAANLAYGSLKSENRSIALFSWDNYIQTHYEKNQLEAIYSIFE